MAKQTFKFQNMTAKSNTSLPQSEKVVEENAAIQNEPAEERTVSKLLNQLSQEKEFDPFKTKYVPRWQLKENRRNTYSREHVEQMKYSILHFGMIDPLDTIYVKNDNEYIIEVGHTRNQAINELIEEYKDYGDKEAEEYQLYLKNVDVFDKRGIPIFVKAVFDEITSYYGEDGEEEDLSKVPEEVIYSEIRLIISNEHRRDESPAEKAVHIDRLSKLYERINAGKKGKARININEQIAKDTGIKTSQVKNYKRVNNLIPGLKKAFDDCKISLKEGSSYASLPEEDQELILQMIEQGQKVSKEEVTILKNSNKELEDKLSRNQSAISELEEEKRRLEMDKAALQEELKSKSEAAEPVILPDPKLPKVEKELKDKENELQDKLQDKEKKILELQATIDAIKNAHKKAELSPQQSRVMKEDLALKSSLEDVKNAIRKLKIAAENFTRFSNNLSGEDLDMLSVISLPELEKEMELLRQML